MVQRIVVGMDGSEGSLEALRWAAQEAEHWGASILAVQAWEFTPLIVATEAPIDLAQIRSDTEEYLERQIREVFADSQVDVQRRVVEELPARAILDIAEAEDADLIVVGTRGRGGLKGLLLGSVSQKVATHATCPVVVVPAPAED
jgi:nucleotide-binding universal stress UspA family protein